MSVKIRFGWPQNIDEIRRIINPPLNAIFAWGDFIFQPNKEEIPADLIYHETIHCQRQKKYLNPEIWWTKWLYSDVFRLDEEVEAFGAQCAFVKKYYKNKALKECIDECAENLSKNYKLKITIPQSHTLIRKKMEEYVEMESSKSRV